MGRSIAISIICLFGLFPLNSRTLGHDAESPTLPAAKLLDDVEVLKRVYETAHPGTLPL